MRTQPKVTINKSKGTLTIEMPIAKEPEPSTSGKTLHLCNTGPAVETNAEYEGQTVRVQAFASIKA